MEMDYICMYIYTYMYMYIYIYIYIFSWLCIGIRRYSIDITYTLHRYCLDIYIYT